MLSQGYNHALASGKHSPCTAAVSRWAERAAGQRYALSWWETIGATGSSLAMLALIAAAADPCLDSAEGEAIYAVYFPWAGAVLALIDSLIDQEHDARHGTHSLVGRYPTPRAAAGRLAQLARHALALTDHTRRPEQHALIIAAMIALFATAPEARWPHAQPAIRSVIAATGSRGRLPLLAMRLKRRIDSRRAETRADSQARRPAGNTYEQLLL